ncbi:MAG: DUF554 domain-containing protein [Erysipelotrichaceae bacterium]
MPYGVIVDSMAVLMGGLIGGFAGERISKSLKVELPIVFGFAAISMGVLKITETNNLTLVILSLILGSILGSLMQIERFLEKGAKFILGKVKGFNDDEDRYQELFVLGLIAFCVSGTGIFGALREGFIADSSILLSKSVLDFFTAMIFASIVGYSISLISIPQFIILSLFFYGAHLIAPYLSTTVLGNFSAVGGIITLMMGFKMANIAKSKAANAIPALLIVVVLSLIFL